MRTLEEIQTLREALTAEKDRMPRYSAFGTDNWASYDRAMDVLNGKFPDHDSIYAIESTLGHEEASQMCIIVDYLNGDVEMDEIV